MGCFFVFSSNKESVQKIKKLKGCGYMNYKHFFSDVASWMEKCNELMQKHGLDSDYFWQWVTTTLARLTEKYGNHALAEAQAITLWRYVNERYDEIKNKNKVS